MERSEIGSFERDFEEMGRRWEVLGAWLQSLWEGSPFSWEDGRGGGGEGGQGELSTCQVGGTADGVGE